MSLERLYTAAELSRLFGVQPATLSHWRCKGTGPAYVKVGGKVRYRESAVEEWISQQERKDVS